VAVDLSRGLLVEAGDATSTPLAQSDVRALPFAAQSFAGVWCAAVLVHQTPDEALDTLREFHRSLAPHGALFVSAQTTAQHGWRVEGDHRRWFETYTLELLAGLLTDAGFVIQQTGENADQVRTGVAWVNALATKG
jgi:ubiquinone/menaquinone biosynthesis C-methylase UbiE